MAGTKTARNLVRGVLVAASLFVVSPPSLFARANAAHRAAADCPAAAQSTDPTVVAGRPYLDIAYDALSHDRARFAGLGPLRRSMALSVVAERHSSYMASIGSWSDGDPAGTVLARVQAAGVQAEYSGQNVVTSNGGTVDQAIETGESFFAREAGGGGPHWDNITNPNHHAVGIGISLSGSPGSYTIYLTQVFADTGSCGAASQATFTDASYTKSSLHVGAVVRPTVDDLQLRSEPKGLVIGQVTSRDRLKVLELDGGWAQVHVMKSKTFGWIFTAFVAAS